MRGSLSIVVLIIGALSSAAPTIAGPLTTPILSSSNTGNARCLECRAANIGKKPVTLVAELVTPPVGTVARSATCPTNPGGICRTEPTCCGPPDFFCEGFCRFTGGSKAQIRASIALTPLTTGDTITSLPAQ